MWSERFVPDETKSRQASWFLHQTLQAAKTAQTCFLGNLGKRIRDQLLQQHCEENLSGIRAFWILELDLFLKVSQWSTGWGPKASYRSSIPYKPEVKTMAERANKVKHKLTMGKESLHRCSARMFPNPAAMSLEQNVQRFCSFELFPPWLQSGSNNPKGHNTQIQIVKCQYPVEIHLNSSS